jgi:molybdate transport system substrate-binding protein
MSPVLRHCCGRLARIGLAGLLLLLAGCDRVGSAAPSRAAAEAAPLLVLAASDLQLALPEIVALYEAESGRRVDLVLGSTGNLTAQIEQGAPADLFFAANERFVDRLAARGLIREETRSVYAVGRIVLAWRTDRPAARGLARLAEPAFAAIAIANPEHAPYGLAAREALQSAGTWEAVRPRLVYGENVVQAFQFVRSGNADAGIVALGVVMGIEGIEYEVLDDALHAPLRQAAAVLHESAQPDAAAELLALVLSDEGQAILRRYGFDEPER